MRLHRLEIEGFGPFLDRQTIDFDRFADDGIFLIAGRTGAGKSSILDAVCFGLYGSVPRYESGDKRLRSDHCAPEDLSEVVVEFSTTAGRYRVTRSPEYQRPAKRGGGMTTQAAAAALDEWIDGAWIGVATRARDVAGELDAILQLTREQFLQVILLAQNRFARFLLADSRERQALLRRLFATERFEDVQARFDERRRAAEATLQGHLAAINAGLEQAERLVTGAELWGKAAADDGVEVGADASSQARLERLGEARARAEEHAVRRADESTGAEKRLTAADDALTAAREEHRAQQDRAAARKALQQLDADEPEIAEARVTLQRARAAEALRATVDAADRAATEHTNAERALHKASEAWQSTGIDLEQLDTNTLEAWAEQRTALSGEWKRAAELEQTAAARAAEQADGEAAVAAASAQVSTLEAERAELPARITQLAAQRDALRRNADRVDDLQSALVVAISRRDAAIEAKRIRASLLEAERDLVEASDALTRTQAVLTQLRKRRLEGFAGELAADLVPGEPCAVCGATEHPVPAEHSDPVSEDDVDEADAVRDAAAKVERGALDRVAQVKSELAAAEATANGRTVDAAETEVATITEAHREAQAAADSLAAAQEAHDAAANRATELEQEQIQAREALSAARSALALVVERDKEAQTAIAEARGAFDTVADRIAEAAAQVALAHALADALDEAARRAKAREEALAAQQEALAASDFDSPTAVRTALRSTAEQHSLDDRITAHTVQREKNREVLRALEQRSLPEELIELAGFEQAAKTAREEWKALVDASGRAQSVRDQLGELIAAAAADYERSAAQQADFEVLKSLADTIAGRGGNTHRMTLETFVLAAELEDIVVAANRRLSDMSTGRYQLQHSDALAARGAASGLGIVVFDAFTGQARPAQSLSGGETFLSSLALALGLAEVVTARAGGIQLDTLFVDEGFGSLDADTLEVAMRTLDELRSGGRTVGVISHVESMQEQIPAQLVVEQTDQGPSRIR